jgi:Zn-dependent M16 (insulinase) family peptidase
LIKQALLSGKSLGKKELTKGIIGAIGDLDAHMLPDAKGYTSMLQYLTLDTEEERQQMRDEILNTKPSDFKTFADILKKVKKEGIIKILGSPNAIEEVTANRPEYKNVLKIL